MADASFFLYHSTDSARCIGKQLPRILGSFKVSVLSSPQAEKANHILLFTPAAQDPSLRRHLICGVFQIVV